MFRNFSIASDKPVVNSNYFVDFIVIRDNKPWFLVEVKNNRETISESLAYYQKSLGVPHAFQVVMNAPFVNADCFGKSGMPVAVPARTFLSQLF